MEATSTELMKNWLRGNICLHMTDTVPGLSFDPQNKNAVDMIKRLKPRTGAKPFLSLVDSIETAEKYWRPLPKRWRDFLRNLWPNPITIIWLAKEGLPAELVSTDGYAAFRLPKWDSSTQWMQESLNKIGRPFPSTSVNLENQRPLSTWQEATAFANEHRFFVPQAIPNQEIRKSEAPSTLLRIQEDNSWQILREGAISSTMIKSLLC